MKLIRQSIASMYETLAGLPPFDRFNLPPSVRVEFRITRAEMHKGLYEPDPHTISISKVQHKDYLDVLMTVAHEMVHLALERKGASDHSNHDSDFNALAAKVCDYWGWNFKEF